MFFYNKDMLRKIGKDEAFIEGLPAQVEKGEFTMADLSNLAKEVVDKGAAQIGIIHRPNAGPDYLMTFASFGAKFVDPASGQLLLPKAEIQQGLEWFAWNAAERRHAARTTPRCRGTRSRALSRPRKPSSTIRASGR